MKTHRACLCLVLAAALVLSAAGANLLVGGDFTDAKPHLQPLAMANGGKVELETEQATWNRCLKLSITALATNANGNVTASAEAFVGSDGKAFGTPVEGDALYDLAFEARGSAKALDGRLLLKFRDWKTGLWAADVKTGWTETGRVALQAGWTRYRARFRTHPGVTRAAIVFALYQTGRAHELTMGPGDAVWIDNVTLTPAPDPKKMLSAGTPATAPVPVRKAIRSGETFSDFIRLKPPRTAMGGTTRLTVTAEETAFVVTAVCEEPEGIRAGSPTKMWTGDVLEVFVGHRQFYWNPSGCRLRRVNGKDFDDATWTVRSSVDGRTWTSTAMIPYALAGLEKRPADGETVRVNFCRTRAAANEVGSWASVNLGFDEVERFGTFVFGSYAAALERQYGVKASVSTRADYESAVQKAETAARDAKYAALARRPFAVAPVALESDFACPFVPAEAFDPPAEILVKAAVNEQKGVPVAILNLTDRTEEYIVRLETDTTDPARVWRKGYNGDCGLVGLEPSRVTVRKALRFKDTDQPPVSVRLDPLPKVDEASSLSVPPKEAGVVWVDFDLTDAKPGTYRGRLRVIPLSEPGKFESCGGWHKRLYSGKMQDVPFALEVRPIVLDRHPAIPGGFFQNAATPAQMKLKAGVGAEAFQADPYAIRYAEDPKTYVKDFSRPSAETKALVESVRNQVAWAKDLGIDPWFFVGFTAHDACFDRYPALKKAPLEEKMRCWAEWIKAVKATMNAAGVDDAHYAVETLDEAPESMLDLVWALHTTAKKAAPTVRLLLTLGSHRMSAANMRRLDPYVDEWVLWRYGYFDDADHLGYVRDAIGRGKKVWHYTCDTSPRTPIYNTYRRHAWFGEWKGLTGNQFYWFQDPHGGYGERDFKTTTVGGFAYRSGEAFIPSLRYMAMREGVNDVRYLAALRRACGNIPAVAEFLKTAAERVMKTEMHDWTAADRVREEAAALYVRYAK